MLNQKDKDRQFWVNSFANKVAQYHAGDLFDIQMKCLDIGKHARLITPSLVLNFGRPPAGAEMEMEVDDSVIMTREQIKLLFWLIGQQGSHADKEFWTHECHDMEKEILQRKAHQKTLATVSTQYISLTDFLLEQSLLL